MRSQQRVAKTPEAVDIIKVNVAANVGCENKRLNISQKLYLAQQFCNAIKSVTNSFHLSSHKISRIVYQFESLQLALVYFSQNVNNAHIL